MTEIRLLHPDLKNFSLKGAIPITLGPGGRKVGEVTSLEASPAGLVAVGEITDQVAIDNVMGHSFSYSMDNVSVVIDATTQQKGDS